MVRVIKKIILVYNGLISHAIRITINHIYLKKSNHTPDIRGVLGYKHNRNNSKESSLYRIIVPARLSCKKLSWSAETLKIKKLNTKIDDGISLKCRY